MAPCRGCGHSDPAAVLAELDDEAMAEQRATLELMGRRLTVCRRCPWAEKQKCGMANVRLVTMLRQGECPKKRWDN